MKKVIGLFSLLICLTFSQAQTISVLNKNEVFKSPEECIVVMDKYTFGKYHFVSEKYDTLKAEFFRMDSVLKGKDSTQEKIVSGYVDLIKNKEEQVNAYEKGFGELQSNLTLSIATENQLKVDYLKLDQKTHRVKKWRNFFMGATGILGTVIVLLVKH